MPKKNVHEMILSRPGRLCTLSLGHVFILRLLIRVIFIYRRYWKGMFSVPKLQTIACQGNCFQNTNMRKSIWEKSIAKY